MTTPDLTPEVVEELRRLAEKASPGEWRAWNTRSRSPEVYTNAPPPNTPNPLIGTTLRKADAAYIAAANPAMILALLARLSHLEEQARKDGEALEAAHPLLETLHSITPKGDANNIVWRTIKAIRARLSDREGK